MFPTMVSAAVSLVAAAVIGLVTVYTTQATIRAQIESSLLQADTTHIGKEREERGRTYEAFLNAVVDARALHEVTVDCAPLYLGTYLVRRDYEQIHPERSVASRVAMSVARKVMSPEDYAECDQAARSYRQARIVLDKSYHALRQWGTQEAVAGADQLVSLFPKVICTTLTSAQGGRQCEYEIAVSAWMVNAVWQRPAGQAAITDENITADANRRDVLAAGRALAWLADAADRIYSQALAQFQQVAREDLTTASTRPTCGSVDGGQAEDPWPLPLPLPRPQPSQRC